MPPYPQILLNAAAPQTDAPAAIQVQFSYKRDSQKNALPSETPTRRSSDPIRGEHHRQILSNIFYPHETAKNQKEKISTGYQNWLPSGYFLFLLRSLYAVICPGESQDWLDRTDRAYTSFFIKGAGRTFSCYTEQQGVIRPHALIIRRARFTDALCPVIRNDCVLVVYHGIPLLISVSGTGSGQGMRAGNPDY
jgi:hypothetical protein